MLVVVFHVDNHHPVQSIAGCCIQSGFVTLYWFGNIVWPTERFLHRNRQTIYYRHWKPLHYIEIWIFSMIKKLFDNRQLVNKPMIDVAPLLHSSPTCCPYIIPSLTIFVKCCLTTAESSHQWVQVMCTKTYSSCDGEERTATGQRWDLDLHRWLGNGNNDNGRFHYRHVTRHYRKTVDRDALQTS